MLPEQAPNEIKSILVVDDSPAILHGVRQTLEKNGYTVKTAGSGNEALSLIKRVGLPHLAIVDLNMPGMDGFEFCEELHKFSDVPVIMLTAEGDEETVVHGLDNFAEDYIIKPFRPAELSSRVRRVLMRIGDFAYTLEPIITIDEDFKVDFPNRKAYLSGNPKPKTLTPTETKILYVLMRNAGRTVTNEFLLRRVWPQDDAYEDRLHTHVYRLRRKIEASPKKPKYIISQWGTGYTFPLPKDVVS